MKIALMGRSLRPPLTGIGRYTANLAEHLAMTQGAGNVRVYVTRDGAANVPTAVTHSVRAPFPTPHELLRLLWEQSAVAADTWMHRADVYHSPNFSLPVAMRGPSVLTVHDLAYLEPGFHNTRLRLYLKLFTEISLRKAARVIAVSQATAQHLLRCYPDVAPRVRVVYSGLDPIYGTPPGGEAVRDYLERLGQAHPYVLYVGTIEPRKNLPRLIRAFEKVAGDGHGPLDLVIAGAWGWRYGPTRAAIEGSVLRDRIKVVGYVGRQHLPKLYAGAAMLVYPSLMEGFGFPPLEAMACGTPVITSNVSSLPEVVGDAALTVTPTDTGAIASAMAQVLGHRGLAAELRERGIERAKEFTWERTVEQTLGVYREAVEGPAKP